MANLARAALLMSALTISPASAAEAEAWRALPPLPDAIGFAGMFAGTLGGRLVAGGGSQFNPHPVWLGGHKVYSNRIFSLDRPEGEWREHAVRLPEKSFRYAHASSGDEIYLIGGMDATDRLRSCYAIRMRGDEMVIDRLPDFPHPISHGAAAIVGRRLIVAGGITAPDGRKATRETWSLSLASRTAWTREPDFPGLPVCAASAAGVGDDFYLFGGMTFDPEGNFQPVGTALRYSSATGQWEKLPSLPAPRAGAASPCPLTSDGKLLLAGGYAEVFPGAMRDHPGFSHQTYYFDVTRRTWENGPLLPKRIVADRDSPTDPGAGPMFAAPCAVWNNLAVVVGGESRASVRTPAVIALGLSRPAAGKPE